MKPNRVLTSLFLACTLLFAQQAGAAHALGHAFEHSRLQDKQAPDSPACDKCEQYAQMGSALHACPFALFHPLATGVTVPPHEAAPHSTNVLSADARGPPAFF